MKPVSMSVRFSPGIFSCAVDVHKRWNIESFLLWKLKQMQQFECFENVLPYPGSIDLSLFCFYT